jgi:hypothetical protein
MDAFAWAEYAEAHKAKMLVLEHRFYGESLPVPIAYYQHFFYIKKLHSKLFLWSLIIILLGPLFIFSNATAESLKPIFNSRQAIKDLAYFIEQFKETYNIQVGL